MEKLMLEAIVSSFMILPNRVFSERKEADCNNYSPFGDYCLNLKDSDKCAGCKNYIPKYLA